MTDVKDVRSKHGKALSIADDAKELILETLLAEEVSPDILVTED